VTSAAGFDNAKVDEEFYGAGVERDEMCGEFVPGTIKSNFLCNIGYGDPVSVRPRAPRLDFMNGCGSFQAVNLCHDGRGSLH
jgi:3-hydroxypropanoate dehydrogenase